MANSTVEPSSPKSSDSQGSRRGVMFRNRESIVEIDGRLANGNSFGEEEPTRKVKSRKPTGFVAQPMKGVGFEDYDEDVEEVEVEKTPKRKVHGRTPTAFVPKKATDRADVDFDDDVEEATAFIPKKAATPNVDFEAEDALDVEEVEVDNTPHRKVKGRQATAFVPKAPSQGAVDFRDDAEEVEADGDDGGPKRAVHGRKATAFVKKGKAVGVEFEDDDEDVEEVEVEQTPKRSVHGRQATAFVPKSKIPTAPQVGFNDGTETLETEEDPDSGPKRSAHGRKATAFVPKARAAGGVSFDDDADQMEVEPEGDIPTRSAHGRKATAFVPNKVGVGFAAEDDEPEVEAKSPVPKLRLGSADEDGSSSPSKRGVRFRGNDSVNEMQDEQHEGHSHTAVRKRVPTKFVQEIKVQEDDEDDHAHVSFADEVSESDDADDSVASTTPKLRPSRARVPTAFEKAYAELSKSLTAAPKPPTRTVRAPDLKAVLNLQFKSKKRLEGRVRWFDKEKGFGKILPLDAKSTSVEEEIFVHKNQIEDGTEGDNYAALAQGVWTSEPFLLLMEEILQFHRRRGSGLLWLLHAICFTCCEGRVSSTLDSSLKSKAQSASEKILTELTTYDDKPNPRLSCSEGMAHARHLVEEKFETLGLKPMGSEGFRFTVPETKDEQCPDGITNLIAVVEGNDETLKDEYILLTAHMDGPSNQGPSKAQGLLQTDNSYDDGGAVAVILSMAEYFQNNPIKRSLLLFISDGEEGIHNVATDLTWKETFCNSQSYHGLPGCHNYPIGFTAWSKNPTVDLQSVKLLMALDPLGAPGIEGHDFVAVLGSESTPGLQALLERSFEGAATHALFINRLFAAGSYSDADAVTKSFEPKCTSALPATCFYGIPSVWLAQTAFAKYHGGVDGQMLLPPVESGMIPFVKIPKELATYALDTRSNFNDKALLKVAESLKGAVTNLGNMPEVSNLVYDPEVYKKIDQANVECGNPPFPTCGFSLQDAINNKNAYDYLTAALGNTYTLDTQVSTSVKLLCQTMSLLLGQVISQYKDSDLKAYEVFPKELARTNPALIAIATMALDFYALVSYEMTTQEDGKPCAGTVRVQGFAKIVQNGLTQAAGAALSAKEAKLRQLLLQGLQSGVCQEKGHKKALMEDGYLEGVPREPTACCQRHSCMVLSWAAPQIAKSINHQVVSYNMAMSRLVRVSHWRQALGMLKNMPEESMRPDGISYNVAISACGKGIQWQSALVLLATALTNGSADLIGFSAAMTTCTKARQLDQALELLKETQSQRLGVDIMLLGSVLGTCERLNKWRTALHVLEQGLRCLGPSNIQQSLPCCHHVLATCTKATRWSVGLQLLHSLEDRHLEPDALTFAGMMEAQSCSSSWKAALWSLERMWMQQLMPSGKFQALQADISCRVQAWWYFNYSLASLAHFSQREVLPALPLPASKSWHQKDPDEGKVYRLSDVTLQLRTAGSLPVLLELQFLRKVFQPAVVEAKELILRGSPMQVGLGSTGLPNILSLATTGLGGLERDAMALLLGTSGKSAALTMYAVMDGHAGISCSNFVVLNLERNILDSLRDQKKRDANAEQILKSSLLAGFKVTEHSFHQYANKLEGGAGRTWATSGSTCCAACLAGPDEEGRLRLLVANVGDSRAVLGKKDGFAVRLSVDHRPDNAAERRRVEQQGGTVAAFGGAHRVFRAMIAKMLVQFLLFPCFVHAIREDSIVHRVGTRAVVITEGTAGTVPVAVNAAIRKVNGRVSRKLKALQEQMEALANKETAAKEKEEKQKQAVEDEKSHSKEYDDRAELSRKAFKDLEDAIAQHGSNNDAFKKAKEDWETLDASASKATKALEKTREEADKIDELKKEKDEELEKMKTALEEEEGKRDKALEMLNNKETELNKTHELKTAKASATERENAEAEMHQALKALDHHQEQLDLAEKALQAASLEVAEAKDKKKMLEKEHGDEKKGLEMLLKVRSAIETFYGKLDALTTSMEDTVAAKPTSVASELIREDVHLKPALDGYNEMVGTFYELHGTDMGIYGSIRDAVAQIKHNTFAALLLQCDPGEKLEMKAEETHDYTELQEKCGTGLWKAAGVKREKFPSFEGKSERIDEWWDANIDVEETKETGSEVSNVGAESMSTETKESTEDTEVPEVTEAEADMQDMEGGQMR
eukprot:symbB.v1.2.003603.t1/scaffold202.1/size271277/14